MARGTAETRALHALPSRGGSFGGYAQVWKPRRLVWRRLAMFVFGRLEIVWWFSLSQTVVGLVTVLPDPDYSNLNYLLDCVVLILACYAL